MAMLVTLQLDDGTYAHGTVERGSVDDKLIWLDNLNHAPICKSGFVRWHANNDAWYLQACVLAWEGTLLRVRLVGRREKIQEQRGDKRIEHRVDLEMRILSSHLPHSDALSVYSTQIGEGGLIFKTGKHLSRGDVVHLAWELDDHRYQSQVQIIRLDNLITSWQASYVARYMTMSRQDRKLIRNWVYTALGEEIPKKRRRLF